MVNQIKNNPMSILSQFGIPQNLSNNPQDIIQHLLNNGQISQDQYNNAIKQAQSMGFKI
jgi:hypothetical protein